MTKTIVITDGAAAVHIDLAGGGGDEAHGVAGRLDTPLDERADRQAPPRPGDVEAGRRAGEDAAIDAEDALTQADEADALDPVG